MEEKVQDVRRLLNDVGLFAWQAGGLRLRGYQEAVARAVVQSVMRGEGLTFVVMFPRQSGKNELQAQIEAFLLQRYSKTGGEMVKVSPTWKPQSLNAMRRLERVLMNNHFTRRVWSFEKGTIYRVGNARITFLSGARTTNIVGATANLLLQVDEAQEILIGKYDKEILPMAASSNATRVLWGTAWSNQTLLARELHAVRQAEMKDGRQRAFVLTADDVRREVPAYGDFVDEQVDRLGRNHPFVRTQFFSEEIEGQGGMFPPGRLALMHGEHPALESPEDDKTYALLVDVAGEDEGSNEDGLTNPGRDATALTVVEVDLSSLEDEGLRLPSYRVVNRKAWVGVKQVQLYGELQALAEHWRARYVVIDATGVGAGLASFLEKSLGRRVIPVIFSGHKKSDLGWGFINLVDTGRYKDYRRDEDGLLRQHQEAFWRECMACELRARAGPGKRISWGAPPHARDVQTGEVIHDDWVVSAALCAALDEQRWGKGLSALIQPKDPFEKMGW